MALRTLTYRGIAVLAVMLIGLCQGTSAMGAVVSAGVIEKAVREYVLDFAGAENLEIKVAVPRACDITIPEAKDPIVKVTHDTGIKIGQHIPVTVEIQDKAGTVLRQFRLVARLTIYATAAVVVTAVPAGEEITQDNVALKRIEVSGTKDYFTTLEAVKGKQAKKRLNAGTLLTSANVRSMYLISRGDEITVEIHEGDLSVRVKGIARENGGIGDSIRVYISMTKKVIEGKVIDSDTVVSGSGPV